jgi:hypothetical protein
MTSAHATLKNRPTHEVYIAHRGGPCAGCGDEIDAGEMVQFLEGKLHCLACIDLDDLEFLPSGDHAVTRRATRYSSRVAIVFRYSRKPRRNERQGILVERSAIERAEAESLGDAEARAAKARRSAERAALLDRVYIEEFARRILAAYPGCPAAEARHIAEHACLKHSGRVGRSQAAKEFDANTIDLAVVAHVRHAHTSYDKLLGGSVERQDARFEVRPAIDAVLAAWRLRTT